MKAFKAYLFCLLLAWQVSAVAQKSEQQQDFSDVLLIINYNHPYYGSIPFLREMYSDVFPNIVFYGEKEHPEVVAIEQHYGWWGQNVMADAMVRWPAYAGYICVQDDCWMNYWNFSRLDKDKIWLFNYLSRVPASSKKIEWGWWNYDCGGKALREAFSKLPTKYKQTLENNLGQDVAAFGWADFLYVPARLREDFVNVCACFSEPNVFVEIAIPNILLCLDSIHHWEPLHALWGVHKLKKDFKMEYDWLHPIKFSSPENQQFIRDIVESRLVGSPQ